MVNVTSERPRTASLPGAEDVLTFGASVHPSAHSGLKRAIDLLAASVGMGLLLLVFFPISIAISLDSPGGIVFKQTRYGLRGKPFQIFKFRTMVEGADRLKSSIPNDAEGPIFKSRNDPRVTRVGKFLRSTSLDELPQFWNVLKGEMSLVGTRPPTADETADYSPRHWRRLNVKPGITGEWQVSGRSSIDNFEEILALDLRYQKNWTPLYDLHIVWKTVARVILRQDAW